jgi:cytochrome b561
MAGAPLSTLTTRALSWATTALPLGICVSIWLLPPERGWLNALHYAVGTAVLAWTVLRIARRPSVLRPRRMTASLRDRLAALRLGVVMIYALLILQSLLDMVGRMLAGHAVHLFGFTVLPALPVNAVLARDVAQLHGFNAALLLILIAVQVVADCYPADQRRIVT